jgi:uncharacterized protein YaaN involved in tellurite resistance
VKGFLEGDNDMGLEFGSPQAPSVELTLQPASVPDEEVLPYDIEADRAQMNTTLTGSEEVDRLVSTIVLDDMSTIVNFGAGAAREISRSSDSILQSVSMSQMDDSEELFDALTKIMSKFDMDEIKESNRFFDRIFGTMKKRMDKIVEKYHTMGDEVDKVYVSLRRYEEEIKRSNRKLEQLFDANVKYYHDLVKYILAGEQACREIDAYIAQKEADLELTKDQSIQFELTTLKHAKNLMEQRTQDLKLAEVVAMQSIPMIRMMEYNNYNLMRKIDSAFIVTLPVFKQALAQAILLKRQRLQAQSLAELDKKTNEMLHKNAKTAAENARLAERLTNGGSVQIETLEDTWKTIVNGIDETKRIRSDADKKRNHDRAKLESIKQDFDARYHMPGRY